LQFTRTQALGADIKPLGVAVNQYARPLNIGVPLAFTLIVSVTDIVAELNALATNIAFTCHNFSNKKGVFLKGKLC